jgi:hypothetical protein
MPPRNRDRRYPTYEGTTGTSTGGGNDGGGGGNAQDPYTKALADANAKEASAKRKAATRYTDQAEALAQQAAALRYALSDKGFRKALEIRLANVTRSLGIQDSDLVAGYKARLGSLEAVAGDNVKSAASDSYAALSNAGREHANALGQAMTQGAGESDVLAAQGAALRNWEVNQSGVARAFFDTQSSINSSLTDLTTDTRAARINAVLQANSDREQLYSNYYDRRSETQTALGNTYGQMAEYYGMAQEQVGSKRTRGQQRSLADRSGGAFLDASRTSARAYVDPGVRASIRTWEGAPAFDTPFGAGPSPMTTDLARPEGASLRRWEA